MVLVTVGEKDSAHTVGVLFKIRNVGNNQVNAQHIVIRKSDSAIDYYDILFVFNDVHILSDLVKTAEAEYLDVGKILFSVCFFTEQSAVTVIFIFWHICYRSRKRASFLTYLENGNKACLGKLMYSHEVSRTRGVPSTFFPN